MQTLMELLTKKRLTNNTQKTREFLSGKKIKIIGNKSQHCQSTGTIIEMTNIASITTQYYSCVGFSLYYYDVVLVTDETIADITEAISYQNKAIKEAEKEIVTLEAKKKFMVANHLEVWNEDEYKVYTVLQTLKGKKTDIEKAKAITELIKS